MILLDPGSHAFDSPERHGFRLVGPEEKDRLLSTYWRIPDRQRETSVVLADDRAREEILR